MRELRNSSNSTLKQIVNKQKTIGDTQIINCSQLREHEDNEYLFGMEGIDRLAEAITRVGFKGAIEVWDMQDGTYQIYSGARRTRATQMAGNKEVKAFVYPYPGTETERRRLLLGANIFGRNAVRSDDPIHTARQIAYHKETIMMEREAGTYDGAKTRAELAKDFGTSEANIYKYESLLSLVQRAQDAVMRGELQIGQGSSMSVLPESLQETVLDAIDMMRDIDAVENRYSIQALIDYVKEHKDEELTTEGIVRAVCELVNSSAAEDPAEEPEENNGEHKDAEPKAKKEEPTRYTAKAARKKFTQCYEKMESFLLAEKEYKEEDREDVLAKLHVMQNLIRSEIEKIGE